MEFVIRSGDIDNRRTAGAEKDAMQAGSRIHRKLQKRILKSLHRLSRVQIWYLLPAVWAAEPEQVQRRL